MTFYYRLLYICIHVIIVTNKIFMKTFFTLIFLVLSMVLIAPNVQADENGAPPGINLSIDNSDVIQFDVVTVDYSMEFSTFTTDIEKSFVVYNLVANDKETNRITPYQYIGDLTSMMANYNYKKTTTVKENYLFEYSMAHWYGFDQNIK